MDCEEQTPMVDVQILSPNEKSSFVAEKRAMTTDDVIEELFRHRTWKYTLLCTSLMLTWLSTPTVVYLTAFAGMLQIINEVCISNHCTLEVMID